MELVAVSAGALPPPSPGMVCRMLYVFLVCVFLYSLGRGLAFLVFVVLILGDAPDELFDD